MEKRKTLNIKGKVFIIENPLVMGILNVTPDSFYSGSRFQTETDCLNAVEKMLTEGADFIDIGGVSTRPFSDEISEKEEILRLLPITKAIRNHFPETIISIDTWRAEVANQLAEEGIDMINDISGGQFDDNLFQTVCDKGLIYVMMHTHGHPQSMQLNPQYEDVTTELFRFFSKQLTSARMAGIKDIIIDPGFGFGKTLEHNAELIRNLQEFNAFQVPVMVGISRKSMIYKTLDKTAENALNGTSVLHTIALLKKVDILRVHDVGMAKEAIKLIEVFGG